MVFGAPIRVVARSGVPGREALAEAAQILRETMAVRGTHAVGLTGQVLPTDLGWTPDRSIEGSTCD